MKKRLHSLVIIFLCLLPNLFFGQQQATSPSIGVPGACGNIGTGPTTLTSVSRGTGPSVQNGVNSIGNIYSQTKCGLNFTSASQRLGKRFTPQGINQPAPFVIAGIPACAVIEKAYLWAEGSGNGAAQTATVNGPLGPANYPMAIVGSGPDKCWGFAGSYTYRADVTASVNGNGTYNISGIMTNPPTAGNDMDGATLLVIWSDATQTYQGTIVIDDGAMINTVVNGSVLHTMTFPAVCGPTTGAQAFCCIGDLQFNGSTVTMNTTPGPYAWNWWNYIQDPTVVNVGQTTANFTVFSPGDCYNLCVCGLYWRTTCVACSGLALTVTETPTTCSNCNGTATVSVAPAGPYTYSWAPSGGNAATATNLCAGTYTCTVTSACVTSTISVVVPQVGGALTLTGTQTNVLCNGACNGTATNTVTGGTAPYTFTWSPATPNATVGNVNSASGLCSGTYTINVTDASGCTGSNTITITQPTVLSAIQSQVNILCNGGTGSASVVASGGTAPYTYAWSPSGGNGPTSTPITVGNYTCTITDANGCVTTSTFLITQPPALTVTTSQVDILCNGGTGSGTVVVGGGTPGYSYAWAPFGGNAATATGLTAGPYTCTATDANGCTIVANITITQPAVLTTAFSQVDELCNGGNTASAIVIPAGGTPAYGYSWAPSGGNGATASGLSVGTYTCTITDANGCVITQSFTITQPTAIVITPTEVDAHCGQADGSASATVVGGTGAYSYNWMPGNVNAQNLTNVVGGTYTVTVTDANGCIAVDSITINNLNGVVGGIGPVSNVGCFGQATGVINITATGGNPNYTYSWLPNISVNNNATGVPAGTYQITVTDANGCTSTVTVTITQPPQLTITATATPTAVCNGTPVTLNAVPAGGTPALNVVWTPGNLNGNSQNVTPTTSTIYTATVTDANGCIDSAQAAVVVSPIPVAALSGDQLSGCLPLCVNFSDLSTVGNPGVISSWSWDFGDNSTANTQNPQHCYFNAGVYTVKLTVTTTDGCTNTIIMTSYIDVFPNPVAIFGATPQPTTILNPTIVFTDSSLNASSWNWSFGDLLNSTSTLQNPTFTYTDPTCYQVVLAVASSNGCVDTTSENICIGPDASIYIPNAFTPNGDGINDVFSPVGLGLDPDHFQMWIFDRWGNMIYYTQDLNKGWDGKVQGSSNPCQIDTYVWKIKALDVTGHTDNLIGKVSIVK